MERSPKLSEAVDFGINSTYLHAHMPKINSSSVKICESSRPRLAQKFSIVTRAVVTPNKNKTGLIKLKSGFVSFSHTVQ